MEQSILGHIVQLVFSKAVLVDGIQHEFQIGRDLSLRGAFCQSAQARPIYQAWASSFSQVSLVWVTHGAIRDSKSQFAAIETQVKTSLTLPFLGGEWLMGQVDLHRLDLQRGTRWRRAQLPCHPSSFFPPVTQPIVDLDDKNNKGPRSTRISTLAHSSLISPDRTHQN